MNNVQHLQYFSRLWSGTVVRVAISMQDIKMQKTFLKLQMNVQVQSYIEL
jgi:hypothetical protein